MTQPMTLDRWSKFLGGTPSSISLPEMELASGRDHVPPLIRGHGVIHLRDSEHFEFELVGNASGPIDALEYLREANQDPYEVLKQCRLRGTDSEGVEWNCGWLAPVVRSVTEGKWIVHGHVSGMSTDDTSATVCLTSGVENVFRLAADNPMTDTLFAAMPLVGGVNEQEADVLASAGEHEVGVLDSRVTLRYSLGGVLRVTLPTTKSFPHPYAENWIAEPFRILFGQLIYPRLVARNFGDGRAAISIRRSPTFICRTPATSLWSAGLVAPQPQQFWELYAKLLSYVALARDNSGHPNFEQNPLTGYYNEIAQASRGTRWVWALTVASVVEGQLKMLFPDAFRAPSSYPTEITQLAKHISSWKGDVDLKSRTIQSLKRFAQNTPAKLLDSLSAAGTIRDKEVVAWKAMRHAVMHGVLIDPWPEKETDDKLRSLYSLVHKLTLKIIG